MQIGILQPEYHRKTLVDIHNPTKIPIQSCRSSFGKGTLTMKKAVAAVKKHVLLKEWWDIMILIIRKKRIKQALSCLCAVGLVGALGFGAVQLNEKINPRAAETGADGNWGLSFQQEGQAPVGNATVESLKEHNAWYVADTQEKKIYLTFDAGFENGNTSSILDTLKKHEVPAAFFLVGNYITSEPDLVKRMVAEGHIVGNHTNTHPDMSAIADKASFENEISELERLYKECTGQDIKKYYRPPQGKYSESNLKMAEEMGYATIFWSLAYVDWYEDDQPTKEEAFEKLLPRVHPGSVVLLHSTSSTNAEILDELLTKWEEMGYTFGSLDDLCSGSGAGRDNGENGPEGAGSEISVVTSTEAEYYDRSGQLLI